MTNFTRTPLSLRVVLVVLLATILGGCASPFYVLNDNFRPKGRSIAVVSGLPTNINAEVASEISAALREQSRFQVMSMARIGQLLKPYPPTIKGPYRSAYFEIDVDWSATDTQKIAEIQRVLGVDYLYVVWAPGGVGNGYGVSLHIAGQLFEFPGGKEVGQGTFPLYVEKTDRSQFQRGVGYVARTIAEKTGMSVSSATKN